jgi:hypothetical protein
MSFLNDIVLGVTNLQHPKKEPSHVSKLSLYKSWRSLGGERVQPILILDLGISGGEWSAS